MLVVLRPEVIVSYDGWIRAPDGLIAVYGRVLRDAAILSCAPEDVARKMVHIDASAMVRFMGHELMTNGDSFREWVEARLTEALERATK